MVILTFSEATTLTDGLYAVYKADNNVNDSLGNYNGTAQGGLTYVAGKNGLAFNPNGTNAYVELPNSTFNGLGTTFTLAVWFNPSSVVTGANTIISTYINSGGLDYGFELDSFNDGTALYFQIYGTSTVALTAPIGSVARNNWSLLLVERIAGTSTKIYVNNTLVASNTSTVDVRYNSTMYASLGALKYGVSSVAQYLKSNYLSDEYLIYNRVLTNEEKLKLYNVGTGRFYPFT